MRIEGRTQTATDSTHRNGMGTCVTAVLPFLVAFVSAVALADDPHPSPPPTAVPLTLTNQDVGLTAAEIQADQKPAASATAVDSVSEAEKEVQKQQAAAAQAQRDAEAATQHAQVAAAAAQAAADGWVPGIGSNREGEPRYETCVEAAIRRGRSLNGSDRLCRVIFPESSKQTGAQ